MKLKTRYSIGRDYWVLAIEFSIGSIAAFVAMKESDPASMLERLHRGFPQPPVWATILSAGLLLILGAMAVCLSTFLLEGSYYLGGSW